MTCLKPVEVVLDKEAIALPADKMRFSTEVDMDSTAPLEELIMVDKEAIALLVVVNFSSVAVDNEATELLTPLIADDVAADNEAIEVSV